VCTLHQPDTKLIPLYLFCKTAKSLGAKTIFLISPYLAYMRQDKIFNPGEGLSSHYFAEFVSGLVDGLITVDPHLHRIKSLQEVYSIKTQVVHAAEYISEWIRKNVSNALLIGPDSESEQWVSEIAKKAEANFTILQKIRYGDSQVEVSLPEIEKYKNCTPVLVDDIISTGRTMIEAITHLKTLKMKQVICIGIHAVFSNDAFSQLKKAGAGQIITCNTIFHESNAIDIADLLKIPSNWIDKD
jgi:ribose-phosphate pyrophosphokinase